MKKRNNSNIKKLRIMVHVQCIPHVGMSVCEVKCQDLLYFYSKLPNKLETEGKTDGWMDGPTDGRMDGWMD